MSPSSINNEKLKTDKVKNSNIDYMILPREVCLEERLRAFNEIRQLREELIEINSDCDTECEQNMKEKHEMRCK
ncbi:MAG: hypothetical protein J6X55_13880 [Victivallales bacterium]|nr:hypothetical protein [Victivallales bacterium]